MEIEHLTCQLLLFKGRVPASVHGPQRGQIRRRHVELFAEMLPQGGGHDAHRIENPTTQPQEADLQRQPQLQRGSPPLLDRLPFRGREREKRFDRLDRHLARDLLQAKKGGLASVHCSLLGGGETGSTKSGATTSCCISRNARLLL